MRPHLIIRERTDSSVEHTKLQNALWLRLNLIQGVRCWKLRQGVATPAGRDHPMFFGLKEGASDLIVCARGLFVTLECKTGDAREKPEQRQWRRIVSEEALGISEVVHSVDEGVAVVMNAIADTPVTIIDQERIARSRAFFANYNRRKP
jgi:hypothetical protein